MRAYVFFIVYPSPPPQKKIMVYRNLFLVKNLIAIDKTKRLNIKTLAKHIYEHYK